MIKLNEEAVFNVAAYPIDNAFSVSRIEHKNRRYKTISNQSYHISRSSYYEKYRNCILFIGSRVIIIVVMSIDCSKYYAIST